jgi:hypothetical protein
VQNALARPHCAQLTALQVLSKSSSERRVVLFTGPSGVGKTAAVKHALRYMMNETSGLEGSPDVIIETLRGRAAFLEEDVVNLALARNIVARAGAKPDIREHEALTLLTATLIDVPYIILLDDADLEGLKRVRCRAAPPLILLTRDRRWSFSPPPARDARYSSHRRRWMKRK